MALPNNILQNVALYAKADLAWMLNEFVAIDASNKMFRDFNKRSGNLGDTITFDIAPRYLSYNGLVVTQQPSVQRVVNLTCSQANNVTSSYDDQQFIFNVEQYIDRFGMAGAKELGSSIEQDILRNIISGVRINDPQNANYGQLQTNSGPYRFYGNGIDPINSFTQLAQAVANFEDFGAAKDNLMGILPRTYIPSIVGSGLNQFALDRNNDLAKNWMLGDFSGCKWATSNLLPVHEAGTVGEANTTLTLVSTNDPTGANVTELTFSGATINDSNAIKAGDMGQFQDNVGSLPNLRFRTFIGHTVSSQPVQFRVLNDDGANGSGNVTFQVSPPLVWAQNQNQNLNVPLQAGMQVKILPSHKAGVLMSGNPLYLAMPQLPDLRPYDSVTETDKDSGASIRHYFGSGLGNNTRIYVRDCIWGSTMVQENGMRLVFPI
jgi:hypothetical protein